MISAQAKNKPSARPISTTALAAKAIRQVLKTTFPAIKFSVRCRYHAAIAVDWTHGPAREIVDQSIRQFCYGHFDGMIDSYEYSNSRNDIPQVQFIFCTRLITRT